MSTTKLVALYGAVGAGGALLGWCVAEILGAGRGVAWGYFGEAATCGLIGGAVGASLSQADALSGGGWSRWTGRIVAGFLVAGVAAAVGASLGHALPSQAPIALMLGCILLGAGTGGAEGVLERSTRLLVRDVPPAALGGLAGGLLFGLVYGLLSPTWEAGGRASAFLLVGACVGAALGLSRIALADAWLIVVDGHGVGRRALVRTQDLLLGRAAAAALSFSGSGDERVDLRHARIRRSAEGSFILEDLLSRHGTRLNVKRVLAPTPLADGDVIRIGGNSIRFNRGGSRRETGDAARPAAGPAADAASPSQTASPAFPGTLGPLQPATGAARRPASKVSPCPSCGRQAIGDRPYCVHCHRSF